MSQETQCKPRIEAVTSLGEVTLSVGREIDSLRSLRVRLWAPMLLGVIMLFDSWDSVVIAYVMPSLIKQWQIGPTEIGALISAGYAGQFLGAILLGRLAERVGRMPVFQLSIVVMCGLAVACALTPNYEVLLVLRFLQGISIGGALPVSITYINELAPTATRGRYFSTFQFITISGYAVAATASTQIIPLHGWRWMFGLGALPIILLPLVVVTLPESPRWLGARGRISEMNRALKKLGGRSVEFLVSPTAQGPSSDEHGQSLRLLFGSRYRRRTAVCAALWFLTSFVSFGLITWIPSIYATSFHMSVSDALHYSAAGVLLFLFVIPAVAIFIDRVGRRPVAIAGSAIGALALAALAAGFGSQTIEMVILVAVGQFFVAGCNVVLWPFTAETYPTRVRALALGLSSSLARAASMTTPFVVGWLLLLTHSVRFVFGAFSLCALATVFIWCLLTKETTRTNLDDVT